MSKKRRTKAQKMRSQSKISIPSISVKTESKTIEGKSVKSYFQTDDLKIVAHKSKRNYADKSDEYSNLKLIKKDLIKSLSVASLILCLEVMLYLFWYK